MRYIRYMLVCFSPALRCVAASAGRLVAPWRAAHSDWCQSACVFAGERQCNLHTEAVEEAGARPWLWQLLVDGMHPGHTCAC